MCKVNEVWEWIREHYPNARFVFWFDIVNELVFEDPDSMSYKIAGMHKDGSIEEVRVGGK